MARRARFIAVLFLLFSWRPASADITVHAPASLDAAATRIGNTDLSRLGDALERAGLLLPPRIAITLIPDDDPRARDIPDWIVGFAVGEEDVVIFPERVLSYPYDSLESVVRHEITHLALNVAARGHVLPRWFHEGVAVSVDAGWTTPAQMRLLLAMLARPDIARLTNLFASASHSQTTRAYLLSAALVDDLRQRRGSRVPGAIVARLADGVPFERAFHLETGDSPDSAAARAWAGYRRWTAWVPALTSPSAAWSLILLLAFVAFLRQWRRRMRRRRQWADEEDDHYS